MDSVQSASPVGHDHPQSLRSRRFHTCRRSDYPHCKHSFDAGSTRLATAHEHWHQSKLLNEQSVYDQYSEQRQMRLSCPQRRSEDAIALVIVMIAMFALMMMAGLLAYSMKVETTLAIHSNNEAELEWLGR